MNRVMHPLSSLRSEMDGLFNTFFSEWPDVSGASTYPALNVWEDERNYFVEAELPGLRMEDLEITILGDELTLKGERKEEKREGAAYHRRERGTGRFLRSIRFPKPVDAEHVSASLHDGILSVGLPKAKEAQPLKITVKNLDQ